ncbi:hypothetical protein CSKR_101372 [Clonorchis sinensis]|uniref:Uncharacterized protein n=2 Tax=Clonorchis sinensis TaxID=79923 RepID=A0A8T1MPK3_CLOSI|nr:hypothetical protein CSKR_101372 [Clonorchis sinensis]GAA53945.1 hypothetical protein CLF_111683 [Clonorchis sinensis]
MNQVLCDVAPKPNVFVPDPDLLLMVASSINQYENAKVDNSQGSMAVIIDDIVNNATEFTGKDFTIHRRFTNCPPMDNPRRLPARIVVLLELPERFYTKRQRLCSVN